MAVSEFHSRIGLATHGRRSVTCQLAYLAAASMEPVGYMPNPEERGVELLLCLYPLHTPLHPSSSSSIAT